MLVYMACRLTGYFLYRFLAASNSRPSLHQREAAGDVAGMTAALIYRALECNTGKVGLASVACTSKAVNPKIAAIQQHQDPASSGAVATNKAIVLELAKQTAFVGSDPQDALKSGSSHLATPTTTLEPATPATSRTTPRAASSRRICS